MREANDLTWQEGSAMIAVVVGSAVFLLEPSLTIARAMTAAWWVKIGGGMIFGAIALAIEQMYCRHHRGQEKQDSFAQFVARYIGSAVQKAVWILWLGALWGQLIFMLRVVSESMAKVALLQSEMLLALVLFAGAVAFASYRKLYAILRAGYLLMSGMGVLFLLLIVLLLPLWEGELIFPWQGLSYGESLWQMGADVGTWCVASVVFLMFPLMRAGQERHRSLVRGILAVIILKASFLVSVLGIFGSIVGGERSFLLYEMAKLVHFSQYIQRVEALFICAWVMTVFLAMVILVKAILILAGDLLNLQDTKPLIGIIVSIAAIGASLATDSSQVLQWSEVITYTAVPIFFIGVGLLLAGGFIRVRRRER